MEEETEEEEAVAEAAAEEEEEEEEAAAKAKAATEGEEEEGLVFSPPRAWRVDSPSSEAASPWHPGSPFSAAASPPAPVAASPEVRPTTRTLLAQLGHEALVQLSCEPVSPRGAAQARAAMLDTGALPTEPPPPPPPLDVAAAEAAWAAGALPAEPPPPPSFGTPGQSRSRAEHRRSGGDPRAVFLGTPDKPQPPPVAAPNSRLDGELAPSPASPLPPSPASPLTPSPDTGAVMKAVARVRSATESAMTAREVRDSPRVPESSPRFYMTARESARDMGRYGEIWEMVRWAGGARGPSRPAADREYACTCTCHVHVHVVVPTTCTCTCTCHAHAHVHAHVHMSRACLY